jgi:trehalose 6-phosphate synthase/phosphatase
MGRLLIVSNRLPIKLSKEKGTFRILTSVGGLATGVSSVHETYDSLWIGWSGYSVKKQRKEDSEQICELLHKEKCYPVFLTSQEIKQHYGGFCNNTIWPLFHYFSIYTKYDQRYWNSYKKVNQKFCDAVLEVAQPGDTIWIHDYHLMLLPSLIRDRLPDSKIGFFLHIPFPSYELFRLLPWREQVLSGMLGADLIGFHTYDYVRHFLSNVHRILGFDHSLSEVQTGSRIVKVDLFPMGIDYSCFSNAASSTTIKNEVARIRKKNGSRKIILSFDRLDYTKGIPARLEAFDVFLSTKPEYKGKVSFYLVTVPSRDNVLQYQMLKKSIDELVGRINGKYGTADWVPIHYFSHFLPFEMLVALYSVADVGLVTPLRDGMNLMAKVFVASKINAAGMLVLSEMTGAAQELGEAIIVNPNNQEDMINAIATALTMPYDEQQKRNSIMQKRLKRYDINRWVAEFLTRLSEAWTNQQENTQQVVTNKIVNNLLNSYSDSKRRLILLDYDGTLVPFADKPEKAIPTPEVLNTLKELSSSSSNEVVIISGRDRDTLTKWFKALDIAIIAEHGAWIKKRSGETSTQEMLSNEWTKEIMPLLELYADRTPGAFVEEKTYSLAWHYRNAEPSLGSLRVNELKDDLMYLTSNLGLAVVDGKKVIEVKNALVNKGRIALEWLSKEHWDFILALGDDKTDEDLFEVLPGTAYSIKVGIGASKARYNLLSQHDVIPLLQKCIKTVRVPLANDQPKSAR